MFLQMFMRECLSSLGMNLMKIKLVDKNTLTAPCKLKCLMRTFLIFLAPVDLFIGLFTADHLTLTDRITNTQIIQNPILKGLIR